MDDQKDAFVARARDLYQSDDIEIDDNAALSENDEGAWVRAWVWVAHSEIEELTNP